MSATISFPLALLLPIRAAPNAPPSAYGTLLPLSLLTSACIVLVERWARIASASLDGMAPANLQSPKHDKASPVPPENISDAPAAQARKPGDWARLHARLSPAFQGAILALDSEEHYVRVHGERSSELILLRLRDAVAEMDSAPGEQTHRSWWVARAAVAGFELTGRTAELRLRNGLRVPVARNSLASLRQTGFLQAAD